MNPLKVALVHRDHPRHMENRMIGMWSYPVPEFEVTVVTIPKNPELEREAFNKYDVVFWEDARNNAVWRGEGSALLVYYVGDSTLSYDHFKHRYLLSRQADLILVDWDRLARFDDGTVPVKRLSYCTNDRLFVPLEKTVDVGFYASRNEERLAVYTWLERFCETHNYSFDGGQRYYADYMRAIGQARININMNRNAYTRAHRCFDVMACCSCLLTSPMPDVSGEDWRAGQQYLEWYDLDQLAEVLVGALEGSVWSEIADYAWTYAQDHIWSARARDLHAMLTPLVEARRVAVH